MKKHELPDLVFGIGSLAVLFAIPVSISKAILRNEEKARHEKAKNDIAVNDNAKGRSR